MERRKDFSPRRRDARGSVDGAAGDADGGVPGESPKRGSSERDNNGRPAAIQLTSKAFKSSLSKPRLEIPVSIVELQRPARSDCLRFGGCPFENIILRRLCVKDVGNEAVLAVDIRAPQQLVKHPTGRPHQGPSVEHFLFAWGLADEGDPARNSSREVRLANLHSKLPIVRRWAVAPYLRHRPTLHPPPDPRGVQYLTQPA